MRQKLLQKKHRNIEDPAEFLIEFMGHSFSESDALVLKVGIRTNWGTARDQIHIFLFSNNVNYGGLLTRDGKIIPIPAHVYTGNGSPDITTRQFQQQGWHTNPKTSWHHPQQLHFHE